MDWKKLACMLAIGLMAVGCGDDDGDDTMTGLDAGPPEPLDCTGEDDRCLFVAATVGIVEEDPETGTVEGFNLDDMVSTAGDEAGCFVEDFVSPSGEEGIDNQLAVLAPTLASVAGDLQESLDGVIADGSLIIMMELNDVDATTDADVTVDLAMGAVPEGSTIELDGTIIAAGQSFDIEMVYVDAQPATITDGVLETDVALLPLPLDLDGTSITLNIRNARLRARVEGNTLAGGVIGGSLNIDELVALAMEVGDIDEALARSFIETLGDLEPDMDGVCQNLSVAITFEGVEANEAP